MQLSTLRVLSSSRAAVKPSAISRGLRTPRPLNRILFSTPLLSARRSFATTHQLYREWHASSAVPPRGGVVRVLLPALGA
ncbi:hypothetical protein FA13DRAFT_1738267 [Coprinellus micaceus]|uniref:Uncharacterized protein n=1 Tax=Coprinellus micaceus TaxID=71717 RepID=A0A4Y7SVA4_COPMI|nr:hypothetical protein FA13DRAFT_1738267 [Coprinellus micaceus]